MNCLARRFRCSAFGVLLAVCWLSQSAKAQPLPDRQSLIGLVVDQNGAPVPETLVSVRRQSDMGAFAFWGGSVRTDKAGRFEFDDAEVGAYFINAEANGFAPALNQSLDLKPGSAPTRLQISRLTSLQLRLMAPPGAPLAQAGFLCCWVATAIAVGVRSICNLPIKD